MARYEFVIDELVLEGFAGLYPADVRALRSALETELARLIAERGLGSVAERGSAEQTRVDGGAFEVTRQTAPDHMGVQAAQAIYTAVSTLNHEARRQSDASQAVGRRADEPAQRG